MTLADANTPTRVGIHPTSIDAKLVFGGTVLGALIIIALLAPYLAPHDPMEQDLLSQYLPPVWCDGADPSHLLGTDNLGRDLLSRLIYGTRPALLVMALGASLSAVIGVTLGVLAGYFGGIINLMISRAIDIFMSFPPMLLTIVLVAVINPGIEAVIAAIVLVGWTRFCRVIRAETLVLREHGFIKSARAIASTNSRILYHEVLPNLIPVLIALFGLEMGRAIVVEAILSFIGFGASDLPTWGAIIADGRGVIYQAWWVMAAPVATIVITVLGLNALGEGIRRSIDPVLRT
jgi:dipeptide transport system permease protein